MKNITTIYFESILWSNYVPIICHYLPYNILGHGSAGLGGMLGGYGGHQDYGHSHGGYTHGGGGYGTMHGGGGHYGGHGKFGKSGKFGKTHGYRKWK